MKAVDNQLTPNSANSVQRDHWATLVGRNQIRSTAVAPLISIGGGTTETWNAILLLNVLEDGEID